MLFTRNKKIKLEKFSNFRISGFLTNYFTRGFTDDTEDANILCEKFIIYFTRIDNYGLFKIRTNYQVFINIKEEKSGLFINYLYSNIGNYISLSHRNIGIITKRRIKRADDNFATRRNFSANEVSP